MKSLPKSIASALRRNKTSLGEHPAFPPEEEEKFIYNLIYDVFEEMSSEVPLENNAPIKKALSKLISKATSIEVKCKQQLEQLCEKVVLDLFDIPRNTVAIDVSLQQSVSRKGERMKPERTKDFTFDSIEDMEHLTDEIYKRRMMNALVTGASMHYSEAIFSYINDLFSINPELPLIYKKILDYNNYLLYAEEVDDSKADMDGGKVSVLLNGKDNQAEIKTEAVLFPVLVGETIKGILELAISHGLPEDKAKAKYVMSKADFKLAEVWDMRLGYALWKLITEQLESEGVDLKEVGSNYFLMELSRLECDEFNRNMREVFARTGRGRAFLRELCEDIMYQKEEDEFDDFVKKSNDEVMLTDGEEYFTSEELMFNDNDDFTPEELITDSEERWIR